MPGHGCPHPVGLPGLAIGIAILYRISRRQDADERKTMTHSDSIGSQGPDDPSPGSIGNVIRNAARYWERGRIGYNLVLTLVTVGWIVMTWPHFRPALTVPAGLRLLVLAALANVCYCTAYPVDIALQHSAPRRAWKYWRLALWCAGVLIAALITCYWIADEIYPDVS